MFGIFCPMAAVVGLYRIAVFQIFLPIRFTFVGNETLHKIVFVLFRRKGNVRLFVFCFVENGTLPFSPYSSSHTTSHNNVFSRLFIPPLAYFLWNDCNVAIFVFVFKKRTFIYFIGAICLLFLCSV